MIRQVIGAVCIALAGLLPIAQAQNYSPGAVPGAVPSEHFGVNTGGVGGTPSGIRARGNLASPDYFQRRQAADENQQQNILNLTGKYGRKRASEYFQQWLNKRHGTVAEPGPAPEPAPAPKIPEGMVFMGAGGAWPPGDGGPGDRPPDRVYEDPETGDIVCIWYRPGKPPIVLRTPAYDPLVIEVFFPNGMATPGWLEHQIATSPEYYIRMRIDELRRQLGAAAGWVTISVAVIRGKDKDGKVRYFVVVSSSEGRESLKKITLNPWETFVGNGQGDAEQQIVGATANRGVEVTSIGATRPICTKCQGTILSAPHSRFVRLATPTVQN